jgi:hypothetical protein
VPITPPPPEADSATVEAADGSSWRPGTSGVVGPADAPSPQEHDLVFVNVLSAAGLLEELRADELARISTELGDIRGSARRLDFLAKYYDAGGDAEAARRRRTADHFLMHRATDEVSAHDLVARLSDLCPEIGAVRLERIGNETDGALVLRCGEHFAGVVDDYELELDTDEIDLRTLEEQHKTTTVRGLVGALNALLGLHDIPWRLLGLRADVYREAYVAANRAAMVTLIEAGLLEDESVSEATEHGGW